MLTRKDDETVGGWLTRSRVRRDIRDMERMVCTLQRNKEGELMAFTRAVPVVQYDVYRNDAGDQFHRGARVSVAG